MRGKEYAEYDKTHMAADGGAAVVSDKILFQKNAGIYRVPSV